MKTGISEAPKRRPGRPRLHPEGEAFTDRIALRAPPSLRARVDAAAEANGRSVSTEVQFRLERSFIQEEELTIARQLADATARAVHRAPIGESAMSVIDRTREISVAYGGTWAQADAIASEVVMMCADACYGHATATGCRSAILALLGEPPTNDREYWHALDFVRRCLTGQGHDEATITTVARKVASALPKRMESRR